MKTKAEWLDEKQVQPLKALRPHGSQWHREEIADVMLTAGPALDLIACELHVSLSALWSVLMFASDGSWSAPLNQMLAAAENAIRTKCDPVTADRLLRSVSCRFSESQSLRRKAHQFTLDIDEDAFKGANRGHT